VLAEFAIVLPVFIIIILGMLEIGRAIMVQQILTNAAREGARLAIIQGATTTSVTNAIVGDEGYLVRASLGVPGREIEILDGDGSAVDVEDVEPHDPIQIVVTVPTDEVGWIGKFITDDTMRAACQMRKE
jgi:hypothetical protein